MSGTSWPYWVAGAVGAALIGIAASADSGSGLVPPDKRYRKNKKPVWVDKNAIRNLVSGVLVPQIRRWMMVHPKQNEPIGDASNIARGILTVEDVNGRLSREVSVVVHSRSTVAKGAAVPSGRFSKANGEVSLYLNGAFIPSEVHGGVSYSFGGGFAYKHDLMQPLHECTHISCIPYGLYSTLLHEVTHSAEAIFPRRITYSPADVSRQKELPKEYLNDPGEVRAFMQVVVDEVVRNAGKDMVRDAATRDRNPNRRLVQLSLSLSTTWRIIESILTPRNRSIILKAVHYALDQNGLLF